MSKALTKVNSLGSNSGPLIALPSPYAHFETGPRMCPPEKSLDNHCVRCRGVRSPQSGLSGNNREIRALFAYFGAKRVRFLCSPDCVAEGEGFEPSVLFWPAKPRRVRKLQIAKPYPENFALRPEIRACNQSGFDSPFIRN